MKILFFGILSDICNTQEIIIDGIRTSNELQDYLYQQYPKLKTQTYKTSVNKVVINENIQLNANDEIALLPPFAGG